MLKYVIWLSLACATLLGAGTALPSERRPRSIWPFSSSEPEIEPLLSEENAKLLEAAGIDKNFNFSSHPVWKIHKYEGIDLKPVVIETEIVKTKPVDVKAESQAQSQVVIDETETSSSEATTDVTDSDSSTTEEPLDLSFFDDLGGLAWFLPPTDKTQNDTDFFARVSEEEEENPGFFRKLWSKIWGSSKTETSEEPPTEASTEPETVALSEPTDADLGFWASLFSWYKNRKSEEELEPVAIENETENEDNDLTTIYLPETQGSYVAVVVPTEQLQNQLTLQEQQLILQQQQQQSQNALLPSQSQPTETFRQPEDQKPDLNTPTSNSELLNPRLNQFTEAETKAAEAAAARVTSIQQQIQAEPEASQSDSKKKDLSRSQAWVQFQSPHASYSYHIDGPGGNRLPETPAVTETAPPVSQAVYQRKIDEVVEEGNVTELPEETVQVQESNNVAVVVAEPVTTTSTTSTTTTTTTEASTTVEALSKIDNLEATVKTLSKNFKKENIDKARDILSTFNLPPALARKLQITEKDVEAILNNEESASKASKRLKSLQQDYERKKEQLSYAYASILKKPW